MSAEPESRGGVPLLEDVEFVLPLLVELELLASLDLLLVELEDDEEAGRGVVLLDVLPGLGSLRFVIDVHALMMVSVER